MRRTGSHRATRAALALWVALPCLAAAGCAPGGSVRHAREQLVAGNLEAARSSLEQQRRRRPDSAEVRLALGETYYQIARDALDRERDETRYLVYLERSVGEFVAAVELDPGDPSPHFYLAVMDVYRGEPWSALRGFENARRLRPSGFAYTNIAEVYVYLGHLNKARRWNARGAQKGARGAALFNDMLMAWREGDVRRARTLFASLRVRHPDMIRTINVARLPEEPRNFEAFAGYCCWSPACGPYLKSACAALDLAVRERHISEETVLRELRLEMETRRRLREIYEQRKELDVEIAPDATAP